MSRESDLVYLTMIPFTNLLSDIELSQFAMSVTLNADVSDKEWYPKIRELYRTRQTLHPEQVKAIQDLNAERNS